MAAFNQWARIEHTKAHCVAHFKGVDLIGVRKWLPDFKGSEHKTTHVKLAPCYCCRKANVYHYHSAPCGVTACHCPSCGLVWYDLKGAENG